VKSGTVINMTHTTRHTSMRQIPMTDDIRWRMAALLAEREQMQEEIRQLSASVQLYSEIVRRLESGAAPRRAA
jgi:uncharacterized membrane protein YjjP (DUF1212 family)